MAHDRRTYVRMDDGMPDNPKIVGIENGTDQALAGWLHFSAICYCSKQKTDGVLRIGMVGRLTSIPNAEAIASLLLEANLWHPPGHECPACVQPPAGHYVVHDYLDHQRSRAEIEELSAKRSAAGKRGGVASGVTRNEQANAKHLPEVGLKQNEADTDAEADTEETPNPSSSTAAPPDPNDRPDIDALCDRLVQLMVANECKRPTVSKKWRDSARLLLDKDGRDFGKAMRLLEWSQGHRFWKSNIHSMPTFRDKYDQLRQQATDEWERAQHGGTVVPLQPGRGYTRPATTDLRVAEVAAAVAAVEAEIYGSTRT